jgi:hypothetical protein
MRLHYHIAAQTKILRTALAMHRGAGADGMHLVAATAIVVLHSNSSSSKNHYCWSHSAQLENDQ